jgi:hypothetical protein
MYKHKAQINTQIRHLELEMREALRCVFLLEDEERIRQFYEPKITALRDKKCSDEEEIRKPKRMKVRYG